MCRLLLGLCCFLLLSQPARSERGGAMGSGIVSCAEFAGQYKISPRLTETVYFAWAQGFMSGMNAFAAGGHMSARELRGMSTEAQESFIRAYCNDHPLEEYFRAVLKLYGSLPFEK